MDEVFVYVEPLDDFSITADVESEEIAVSVSLEHEIAISAFEYPAEVAALHEDINSVKKTIEELQKQGGGTTNEVIAEITVAESVAVVDFSLNNEQHIIIEFGGVNAFPNDTSARGMAFNEITFGYVETSRGNSASFVVGRYAFYGTMEVRVINSHITYKGDSVAIYGTTAKELFTNKISRGFLFTPQTSISSIKIYGPFEPGAYFKIIRG